MVLGQKKKMDEVHRELIQLMLLKYTKISTGTIISHKKIDFKSRAKRNFTEYASSLMVMCSLVLLPSLSE